MEKTVLVIAAFTLLASNAFAEERTIGMAYSPSPATLGKSVHFTCKATGDWTSRLSTAQIWVYDTSHSTLVSQKSMKINGMSATYDYTVPASKKTGNWDYKCYLKDSRSHKVTKTSPFLVVASTPVEPPPVVPPPVVPPPVEPPPVVPPPVGSIPQHLAISSYDGPSTCIACHQVEAQDMLNSLHMQWSGPTTKLSNASGQVLGKAVGGINTFCTYAPSSKGACYSCHVRADGNAPHPPDVNDVDCLMCHSDTYQRTTVADPTKPVSVTDIYGKVKTYIFGAQDAEGNYTTVPDYALMPTGTTMESLAQNVHKPTKASCLRCHAKAGGGDWTKRGDMGLSTKNPPVTEDVHMSSATGGKNMTCTSCHVSQKHKIGGRGIDLRASEATEPKCTTCHTTAPHSNADYNRHSQGQVACQTCHIRTFGKGGATEMSRDWLKPVWNPAFCSGQGGYVGEEVKVANVKPQYRWFDGTSYVYNVGETIAKNADGTYTMAKANGKAFDGKSKIVPIKDHWSIMALHESGKIIPPVIMDMFMTGDFDKSIVAGMEEQGMTGSYTIVRTNAEMLITHGVDPKSKAPTCTECHDTNGKTVDGTKMLPFGQLGYHTWPAKVASCTLCHSAQTSTMTDMHNRHAASNGGSAKLSCVSCHTSEPTGLVKPTSDLCNDCHSSKSWSNGQELHKKHIEKGYQCVKCHKF
jgi:hypothetical protein